VLIDFSVFMKIVQVFPSMDVDDETFEAMEEEGTDNRLTEYSIGRHIIYAAFAWSVAEEAYETVRALAAKHQIGFFDVSGSAGDIIRP